MIKLRILRCDYPGFRVDHTPTQCLASLYEKREGDLDPERHTQREESPAMTETLE